MSDFSEFVNPNVTRRDFVSTTAAAASFCLLNCAASGRQVAPAKIVKALDDRDVIHGIVGVKSGGSEIDAYLSRPRKEGRYPAVIVIAGNSINEEYIQNTTAMLAQKNLVGVAPNIYSLQKEAMTPEEKRKVLSAFASEAGAL